MEDRGALPKHMQISEMLVREIAAGRLADGARLPPERDMAGELGVAVGTLRRALTELTDRGLLERVQGSGNYVRHRADAQSIYAFFRLEIPGGGGLPTAEVVSADAMARPPDAASEGGCDRLLCVRRVRSLDGEPVALEEIWLDIEGAADLTSDDLSESLYLTYQRELGVAIERTEDRVGIGQVPQWGAGLLDLAPGDACGYVARRGWSRERVVEVSSTWFDANRAQFVSRMR
ncbi:MAG: GntR family transcriptional regulator [Rhodobacteraceae bacterium]|nr:GntR family transcriptional regulator [Paracoccaceae bacterium]